MCGIIGVFKKTGDANRDVANIFQEQADRGNKGFGTLFIKDKKIIEISRACEPALFIHDLLNKDNLANMIVSHHRFPTSSDNLLSQTHPIVVANKNLNFDYYVVHNGVINNEDDLRTIHEDLGYKYTTLITETRYTVTTESFNDSESLAIELAMFIERKKKTIDAKGSFAFIVIQVDKKEHKIMNVFFGTNGGNPLKLMAKKGREIILRSEGNGINVKSDILFFFSPSHLKKLGERKMTYPAIKIVETKLPLMSKDQNDKLRHVWKGDSANYDFDEDRYKYRGYQSFNRDPELSYGSTNLLGSQTNHKTEDGCPIEETEEELLLDELRSDVDSVVDDIGSDISGLGMENRTKYTRREVSEWKRSINEKVEAFFISLNDLLQDRAEETKLLLEEEANKELSRKQFDKEVEKMFCDSHQK